MAVVHWGLQMALLSSSVENFLYTVLELIQLSINPQKMVTVRFTQKLDLRGVNQSSLDIHYS